MTDGTTSVTHIPEPSALEGLLLGTGMLGLVEMARRKLQTVSGSCILSDFGG
jgi:hypothetical protein